MKFWTQMHGWVPISICLGLMLAQAQALAANDAPATAANDAPRCLSLQEVHGGYPRQHTARGRRCLYASTPAPAAHAAEVDGNPYHDPFLHVPYRSKRPTAAVPAKNSEHHA